MIRQRTGREAGLVVSAVVSGSGIKFYITPPENVRRLLAQTPMNYRKHNTSSNWATRRKDAWPPSTYSHLSPLLQRGKHTTSLCLLRPINQIAIVHLCSVTRHTAWPPGDQISLYNGGKKSQHSGNKSTGTEMEKAHLSPLEWGVWGSNGISRPLPRSKQGREPVP